MGNNGKEERPPKKRLPKHQREDKHYQESSQPYTKQFSKVSTPIQQSPSSASDNAKHTKSSGNTPAPLQALSYLSIRPIPADLQAGREGEILIPVLEEITVVLPFGLEFDIRCEC